MRGILHVVRAWLNDRAITFTPRGLLYLQRLLERDIERGTAGPFERELLNTVRLMRGS